MAYIDVGAALDEARALRQRLQEAQAAVGIVRTDLRHAVTLGHASRQQAKEIAEMFPPRKTSEEVAATTQAGE